MVNIHEGKGNVIITCSLAFNPHELPIRDGHRLSDACHSALHILNFIYIYIGLDFDPNLKANKKNNNKLWNNEHRLGSKNTPN